VPAGRERDAIPALWSGALTYIRKPYDADELLLTIERARADLECRREVVALRARLRSVPELANARVPVAVVGAAEMGWTLAELERQHILRTLELCSGNQSRAAGVLGVDRRTLYRKLKDYRVAETGSHAIKRKLAS
jgi:DNA-binding NtrC family response regulator